ncbi:MAG: phosphate signaling complex protein PhoU [Lentisphaeria bacterium]
MSYHLQNEIQHLRIMTQKMAGEVEQALNKAVHAFLNSDKRLAQEVIANDTSIDMAEIALEEECLKTLALYQPVAIDLRLVVSCLKINSDLERIGDLAVKIAKRSLTTFELKEKVEFDFHGMMLKTQEMLKLSLDSLLRMDVIGAREVTKMDSILDEYKKIASMSLLNTLRKIHKIVKYILAT